MGFKHYQTFIGKKINSLTILEIKQNFKNNSPYFFCRCDCGNEKWIICYDLIHREYKSCGNCYDKKIESMIGTKINNLEIIDSNKERVRMLLCVCSCGNRKWIRCDSVLSGHTKSCGQCITTQYLFDGDICIGKTSQGKYFYVNAEDYDLIKDYNWQITSHGYVSTSSKNNSNIYMHRLIMQAPKNKQVDHINREKADNRKENLRIVSQQVNSTNISLASNNTSGKTGVHWNRAGGKWCVQITKDGKKYDGGRFNVLLDAINKRKEMEIELYGYYFPS